LGVVAILFVVGLSILNIFILLLKHGVESSSLSDFFDFEQKEKQGPKRPTRNDIDVPGWVEVAMMGRYFLLFLAVMTYVQYETYLVPILFAALFFGSSHVIYRVYRKHDPVSAEIAFYNEEDGYHSSGDDDGDGGD
jgi:hypothetical protein